MRSADRLVEKQKGLPLLQVLRCAWPKARAFAGSQMITRWCARRDSNSWPSDSQLSGRLLPGIQGEHGCL